MVSIRTLTPWSSTCEAHMEYTRDDFRNMRSMLLQPECTAGNATSISVAPNMLGIWETFIRQTMGLNATCATRSSRTKCQNGTRTNTCTNTICEVLMGYIRVNKYYRNWLLPFFLGRSNWCDICSKSVVNFKRHMNDVHGTNNEVVCEVGGCGKVLKNNASWKYHLRNSHGVYQSK